MLWGRLPWCYSAARSGRLFEDGRQLRVSFWCRGSSKAMTRTSRWKVNLYQTQLSRAGRGVGLPRLGWPQLARLHRWWPWLARNAPFLWAGQRWLVWSHSCHLSSRLRSVVQWQNPSRGLSIDELVQARIAGLHRACVWLPLSPSICHSPWHRPQHLFGGLANSISGRRGPWFYQYRNVLLEGCCSIDWWVLFGWLLGQRVAPSGAVLHQPLHSRPSALPPWFSEPRRLILAALRASDA